MARLRDIQDGMIDTLAPPVAVLAKIGSIIVHLDEGSGNDGHQFDWIALGQLLADRDVQTWLDGMRGLALVPVKRRE